MKLTCITTILFACAAGAASSGCTRTSDGSVVMTYSPTLPHFLYPERSEETVNPRERMASLDRFPSTPAGKKRPRRAASSQKLRAWKVKTIEAPFVPSDGNGALNCHRDTSRQGRVRVVCD